MNKVTLGKLPVTFWKSLFGGELLFHTLEGAGGSSFPEHTCEDMTVYINTSPFKQKKQHKRKRAQREELKMQKAAAIPKMP